jgi:hypothetical protein
MDSMKQEGAQKQSRNNCNLWEEQNTWQSLTVILNRAKNSVFPLGGSHSQENKSRLLYDLITK